MTYYFTLHAGRQTGKTTSARWLVDQLNRAGQLHAIWIDLEVAALLLQHTDATGQRFEPEAIARVFELSQGHPWLVNALADQVVDRDVEDRAVPITAAHVEVAKETIILERRTHIDSLIARLREPRVLRILDPMLAGEQTALR